jgi:hypothetical protein
MKQITLTLTIDPATAVRAGKAFCGEVSRVLTEEELGKLTSAQRETLARHLAGEWGFPHHHYGEHPRYSDCLTDKAAPISDTSIETLARLLDEREAGVRAVVDKIATDAATQRAKADAAIRDALAEEQYKQETIKLDSRGNPCQYDATLTTQLMLRQVPSAPYESSCASPEILAAFDQAREEARAERALQIASIKPRVDAAVAELAAKEQAIKDERTALEARLPAGLRARMAEGFDRDGEVERELRKLIRRDAGYPATHDGWDKSVTLDDLTDDEYTQLVAAREGAAHDATVTPKLVWNVEYRAPEDDDDRDDIDSDGEVPVRANERRLLVVQWSRGGLVTQAVVPFVARTDARTNEN